MSAFDNFASSVSWCYRVIARPVIERGGLAAKTARIAAFSTVGRILDAIGSGVGGTLQQIGESEAEKLIAKNDAEVQKARAVANANRLAQVEKAKADARRQEARIAKLEADLKQAEVDQAVAATERLRIETQQLRQQGADRQRLAQIEAWERVEAAISRIEQKGGSVLFDPDNLKEILRDSMRFHPGTFVEDEGSSSARIEGSEPTDNATEA